VLLTYYEQLITKGKDLNIITDNLIEEAIQVAKQCDDLRSEP
jgi:hypothetical protein